MNRGVVSVPMSYSEGGVAFMPVNLVKDMWPLCL